MFLLVYYRSDDTSVKNEGGADSVNGQHGLLRTRRARLLRVQEAAELLGVSRSHIYNLIEQELIPAVRLGRVTRIDPADLDALIARVKTGTGTSHGGSM